MAVCLCWQGQAGHACLPVLSWHGACHLCCTIKIPLFLWYRQNRMVKQLDLCIFQRTLLAGQLERLEVTVLFLSFF